MIALARATKTHIIPAPSPEILKLEQTLAGRLADHEQFKAGIASAVARLHDLEATLAGLQKSRAATRNPAATAIAATIAQINETERCTPVAVEAAASRPRSGAGASSEPPDWD